MTKILPIVTMTLILLMVVVSGCDAPPTPTASLEPSVEPTPSPTPVPATPTPAVIISFAGNWHTDMGDMVLTIDGDKATGTYGDKGGKISGTVTDNVLEGTWSEAPSDAGDFKFTLSGDGNKFTGLWRKGHSDDPGKSYDGFWYGTKIT